MQTDNEKYNENVLPNTAFLRELKNKLPDFWSKNNKFNIEKFRNALKKNNINELKDGYQLNFIGKDYARKQSGEMPTSVIVPDKKQNNGEGKKSKNLFFTGDNLEVLRHLQSSYLNKVDVIYIDPPYNTGNDGFAYDDSFEFSDDKLEDMFEMTDAELSRLKSIIKKSSHSAWLTFMYPRLSLAKKLLSSKGIMFISIDENEQANLKEIISEIMGEDNVIANIPVINNLKGNQDQFAFAKSHEYLLCCSKNVDFAKFNELPLPDSEKEKWSSDTKGLFKKGANLKASGINAPREKRPNLFYPIYVSKEKNISLSPKEGYEKLLPISNGQEMSWRWSKNKMKKEIEDVIVTGERGDYSLYKKQRPSIGDIPTKKPKSFFYKPEYSSGNGTNEIIKLFGEKVFTYPKPTALIKDIVFLASRKNSIVLDFFSGSGTTADAVLQLNAKDNGKRKFILVQLPEKTYEVDKMGKEIPTSGGKIAFESGYKSIDEIARERIRRAFKKIKEENELTLPEDFDGSFKHYRVVKPNKQTLENIEDFDPNSTNLFTNMIDSFSSKNLNVSGDATGEETILTTWLIKDGYSFDSDIKAVKFADYVGYVVEENRLYIINEGWGSNQTESLLNQLGCHQLNLQSVIVFGYSLNIAELRELETGLNQLDNSPRLIKRY